MTRRVLLLMLALAVACRSPQTMSTSTPAAPADLVFHDGTVFTNDPAKPRAEAVAVRGSRIAAVGSTAELQGLVGPKTRDVNLRGGAVIPSLTDAHCHLAGFGLSLRTVDLRGCTSPADCAGRLEKFVATVLKDDWVLGRGWDQNLFPGKAFPTHESLDSVSAGHPAALRRVDGHALWANAEALRRAGITASTPDPPGGRILRDAKGQPTGILVDAAEALLTRVIPPPSDAEIEKAILAAQGWVLAQGLTGVHEMGVDGQTLAAYRRLAASGQLQLRVTAYASADALSEGTSTYRNATLLGHGPDHPSPEARFTLNGVKLYADGALGSRGAALLAPYNDEPGNRGLVITSTAALQQAARKALGAGFQVAVHAIGDAANRSVLDAYAGAGVTPEARFRIEHAQVVDLADIPRFAQLGVIASMQPTHATSDMPWAEERLGKGRLAGAYAWRRFMLAGVHVPFGSDFPVESSDPRLGLFAAITRTDENGNPPGGWLPDQRVTLDEAVRGFSEEAAYAAFQETWRGHARVGDVADLTVFRNPLDGDAKAILSNGVMLTLIGGSVVFEAHQGAPSYSAP
jgi:predicted amidohydrolase YtcJ